MSDELKEQIKALAQAHEDGIDTVSGAIKDLYLVTDHLTTQLRQADITIATLKQLLIRKSVLTAEEVDGMCSKISNLANKKIKETCAPEQPMPVINSMQEELRLIHESAKEASADPSFIFGGS